MRTDRTDYRVALDAIISGMDTRTLCANTTTVMGVLDAVNDLGSEEEIIDVNLPTSLMRAMTLSLILQLGSEVVRRNLVTIGTATQREERPYGHS
jgi:hypothetical protein